MDTSELWVDSYQGEVLGETLFGLLAEREQDATHRSQLEVLTVLERATKALAEPVFDRKGLDRGDTEGTVKTATELANAVAELTWAEFMGSFASVTAEFLAKYRRLVELATDEWERDIAQAYVAHELALAGFALRSLGLKEGEPLAEILALPHVAVALAS